VRASARERARAISRILPAPTRRSVQSTTASDGARQQKRKDVRNGGWVINGTAKIRAGRREAPPRLQTAKFCPVREAPANSFAPILLAFATAFQFACTATQAVFRAGKGPAGPFRFRERTRGSFFVAASGPGPHPVLARVRILSGPRSACVLTRVLCRNGKGPAGHYPQWKTARGSFCVRLRPDLGPLPKQKAARGSFCDGTQPPRRERTHGVHPRTASMQLGDARRAFVRLQPGVCIPFGSQQLRNWWVPACKRLRKSGFRGAGQRANSFNGKRPAGPFPERLQAAGAAVAAHRRGNIGS